MHADSSVQKLICAHGHGMPLRRLMLLCIFDYGSIVKWLEDGRYDNNLALVP